MADAQDQSISVRTTKSVKEAAEAAAKADGRKVADYVKRVLIQDLRAKGFLKGDE